MKKASRLFKLPLPEDARPVKGDDDAVSTEIGTVDELTAFYRGWMLNAGWTFDAKNSVVDPREGVKRSMGFTSSLVWCKPGRTITTVAITVGSGDSIDRGRSSQIYISKLDGEESCP